MTDHQRATAVFFVAIVVALLAVAVTAEIGAKCDGVLVKDFFTGMPKCVERGQR